MISAVTARANRLRARVILRKTALESGNCDLADFHTISPLGRSILRRPNGLYFFSAAISFPANEQLFQGFEDQYPLRRRSSEEAPFLLPNPHTHI